MVRVLKNGVMNHVLVFVLQLRDVTKIRWSGMRNFVNVHAGETKIVLTLRCGTLQTVAVGVLRNKYAGIIRVGIRHCVNAVAKGNGIAPKGKSGFLRFVNADVRLRQPV